MSQWAEKCSGFDSLLAIASPELEILAYIASYGKRTTVTARRSAVIFSELGNSDVDSAQQVHWSKYPQLMTESFVASISLKPIRLSIFTYSNPHPTRTGSRILVGIRNQF